MGCYWWGCFGVVFILDSLHTQNIIVNNKFLNKFIFLINIMDIIS